MEDRRESPPPPPHKIDEELVRQLATLAKLTLQPDQLHDAVGDLERLLGAFACLEQVAGLDELPPLLGADWSQQTPPPARQTDEPSGALRPEQVIGQAPEQSAGQFLVPRVVKREGS